MRSTNKLTRHFGFALAALTGIAASLGACKGGSGSGSAGCPDDEAFFEENLWKPVMSQKCVVCHSEGGLAKDSGMVLKPGSDEATIQSNFEIVREVAQSQVDGTSVLLLKPSGRHPEGHTGGTLLEFNGPEYNMFAAFVDRVTKGRGCGNTVVTCNAATPGARLLRRLTRSEYDATVHDLFPSQLDPSLSWGSKFAADAFVHGFDNNAATLTVSGLLADQAREAAEDIAEQAMKNPGTLVPCDPAKGDDACAAKFIETFGARAFRRPLTADDKARYTTLYKTVAADGFSEGIKTVITAMLQSPYFLYRAELGEDGEAGASVKLTPYEIATELSYFLWGTMPDDALFAAASSGALASQAEIDKQAQRLFQDPRSDAVIARFVDQWLDLYQIDTVAKDSATYPDFDAATRAALHEETQRFVTYVIRKGSGTLDELLTATYSFMNPALAKFYGVQAPAGGADADGFAKVDVSAQGRAGVLTQGSVVAIHSKPNQSSPIHRGKLVRERLLCQDLPPPPAGLNVQPPAMDPSKSTRERYAAHRTQEVCASCHNLIDPIGYGFEHFDGIGRYRDQDSGKPIDATGEISSTANTNGDFDGTMGLAGKLAKSPDVQACFAKQWVRFGYGLVEDAAMGCISDQVSTDFQKSGLKITDLLLGLTRTAHFTSRVSDAPPGGAGAGATTGAGSGAGGASGGTTAASGGATTSTTSSTGGGPVADVTVDIKTDNDWGAGYQKSVKVTNVSSAPVTWKVTIAIDGKITDSWNSKRSGDTGQVTFTGADFNATVQPGDSVSFGFVAAK